MHNPANALPAIHNAITFADQPNHNIPNSKVAIEKDEDERAYNNSIKTFNQEND